MAMGGNNLQYKIRRRMINVSTKQSAMHWYAAVSDDKETVVISTINTPGSLPVRLCRTLLLLTKVLDFGCYEYRTTSYDDNSIVLSGSKRLTEDPQEVFIKEKKLYTGAREQIRLYKGDIVSAQDRVISDNYDRLVLPTYIRRMLRDARFR